MSVPGDGVDRKAVLRQALAAVAEMQAKLEANERARREPIAIVGMSCRLPGGIETPERLWDVLRDGVDAVSEVPADRWDVEAYYDADPAAPGKMSTRRAGFLSQVDRFDPQFFGIAPREALSMDPQQRLLLEVSWEALERAGQAPDRLTSSLTGVFVGITTSDYAGLIDFRDPKHSDVYAATGNALNAAAGRLAFTLGLQGPCMAIDTACSSSLVALHTACLSLRTGESDLALAAGVNVMLAPETFVLFSKWGMLAPDGRCKTFDARADGFVRGEGCAVLVLKRLSDAVANGDDVLAVVRGSAVNQDGRSSGLTVPNGPAQQAVIRRALAAAGVSAADIDYVEAHGTGTPLGDPIEVEAIAAALGKGRRDALAIGSIKTNIGHVEAASGLAGVMKVVLALQHDRIPKHLHFERPNPRIDWDMIPVRVAAESIPWPRTDRRRLAGVSSFGFSGTNAHVILEEAPLGPSVGPDEADSLHVFTLSARNDRALEDLAGRYGAYLSGADAAPLSTVCFTANTGRAQLSERLAVLGTSAADIAGKLAAYKPGADLPSGVLRGDATRGGNRKLAMLFTGQGSQYPGMGRGLYESEPVFRAAVDECARQLDGRMPAPLLDVLYGSRTAELNQTACTQPALFAVEYALSQLWRSWGVVPGVVLGHSVGEYVAACVAGVLDLDDALTLIAARGRLMQALPARGVMAAVFGTHAVVDAAVRFIGGPVSIAAVNSPQSVVVSGAESAVNAVLAQLAAGGVKSQRLTVSHAFHSPLMEPMLDEFENIASTVRYRAPQIGLVSNETARWVNAGEIDAAYWRRHVRAAVQYEASIAAVGASGYDVFVEAGPAPTLIGLGRRCVEGGVWIPSLRQGRGDREEMRTAAATLYAHGVTIAWGALEPVAARRKVTLPTYPFQRARYWVHDGARLADAPATVRTPSVQTSLSGRRLSSPLASIQFETELTASSGWLADHVIRGAAVFPATGHIELARDGAARAFAAEVRELSAINNHEALVLHASEPTRVQTILEPLADGRTTFRILSQRVDAEDGAPWQLHVSGAIAMGTGELAFPDTLAELRARSVNAVPVADYYAAMHERGLEYGERFRGVTELWEGDGEAIGRVSLPSGPETAPESDGGVHPALLDACFHVIGRAIPLAARGDAFIPVGTDRVAYGRQTPTAVWSHATVREGAPGGGTLSATVRLFDEDGRAVAIVEGLRLKRMRAGGLARWAGADERQWLHVVEWTPAPVTSAPAAHDTGAPGSWLIFADGSDVAEALGHERAIAGDAVVWVHPQEHPSSAADHLTIDAELPESYAAVLRSAPAPLTGVCFAWGAAQDPSVEEAARATCRRLLLLTKALAAQTADAPVRLVLLTRGAAPVSRTHPVDIGQAARIGFLRSVARELPQLQTLAIDLDPTTQAGEARLVAAEIDARDGEDEVGYRDGVRYVPRLVSASARSVGADDGATADLMRVRITERGVLDNLTLMPIERTAPGDGEVEIEVRAAGLNFRDVLNALGMYPGDAGPLGSDCAGVVTRVGPRVAGLQVGDEVVGLVTDCLGSFATGPAGMLQRKPSRLTFTDAVTLPNAFLTAQYALERIGELRRGERVLIHAATGGVGLAAVQLARAAGAEVFATAGSPRKRAFLRSIGIQHVMDSRTTSFGDEIAAVTAGEGVHVVLNSLSGGAIERSLTALAPGGRFLEIGKNGIWSAEAVAAIRPDVRYAVIDLGEAIQRDLAPVQRLFSELVARVESGELQPLPTEIFALADVTAAFRHMAAARHIGKIVIVPPARPARLSGATDIVCSPAHTYLVTGGFGGLGLEVGKWLASRGATRLVLLGRHEPVGPALERVQALAAAGVEIVEAIGDVSSRAFVSGVFSNIARTGFPLRGIVHAAGVVRDSPVQQLEWEQYADVWAAKAAGAWNLHVLTAGEPIDFFVSFSSMSAVLGSAGQTAYTSANSFVDALAHARRAHGLPAVSINWGPWSEVGMAAGLGARDRDRWAAQGIGTIAPDQGLRALGRAIALDAPQVSVLPIDWRRFLDEGQPGSRLPLLRAIAASIGTMRAAAGVRPITFGETLASTDAQDRADLLLAHVRDAVGRVLAFDSSQLSDSQGLTDIGMDSLMAVELSNRLGASLGRTLAPTLAFEQPTIAALTLHLGGLLGIAPRATRPATRATAEKSVEQEVAGLSEDEVAASLAAELEQAGY